MRTVIFIFIYIFVQSAFAVEWVDVDVNSIKSFTEQDNHYVYVSGFTNPDNCPSNTVLVIIRNELNNWKMVHSNTLAGFLAGKSLEFRVDGCSGSYAVIDGVHILN